MLDKYQRNVRRMQCKYNIKNKILSFFFCEEVSRESKSDFYNLTNKENKMADNKN